MTNNEADPAMVEIEKYDFASAKVMRSYDYCHFEITLGSNMPMTVEQVDEMRKDAARLADKAVRQYQIARRIEDAKLEVPRRAKELREEVKYIKKYFPNDSDRTPQMKAKLKTLRDYEYACNVGYNYEDDCELEEIEDNEIPF